MTTVNKMPLSYEKVSKIMFKGLVKAGSTQAIKMGEIVCLNKTYAGYFSPYATITKDYIYPLAITAEEQKSTDLERYITMYALAPWDIFEFSIAAARSLALGDNFVVTTSNSQQLTYDLDGSALASQFDYGHYPQKTDTTIRNRSVAQVSFNPAYTYYGLIMTKLGWNGRKVVNAITALTLYDFMSGLIITNLGLGADSCIHVLPTTPILGTRFTVMCQAAFDTGFEVGSQGAFFVEGAKQTDDKNITIDALGDSLTVTYVGDGDWFAETSITSAADQTAGLDIEG